MRVIFAALVAALFVTPAFASHHPAEQGTSFIDAAAVAPYPAEVKAVHHVRHARAAKKALRHERRRKEARPKPEKKPEREASAPKLVVTASAEPDAAEYTDGIATPHPIIVTDSRPRRLEGIVKIADAQFRFVSGGAGWSIPNGDYEISPDSQGDWGSRHGALDLTGSERGTIHDSLLGRDREGIELHSGPHDTEGCVSIDQWSRAKSKILAMIDQFGRAFLHVWPGAVSITPLRSSGHVIVALHQSIARDREAKAERRNYGHAKRRYARHHRYRHYARG